MNNLKYLSTIILLPYLVGTTPDSTGYTDLSLGFGGGQYEYADCSGVEHRKFADIGISIIAKPEAPVRYGMSIGMIGEQTSDGTLRGHPFVWPVIGYDSRYFYIGTTGLQLGSRDNLYVEIGFGDQIPAYSGRGLLRVGIGGSPKKYFSHLWVGMNAAPYAWGPATQVEMPLSDNRFLFFNARYGPSSLYDWPELAFSIGLRLRNP